MPWISRSELRPKMMMTWKRRYPSKCLILWIPLPRDCKIIGFLTLTLNLILWSTSGPPHLFLIDKGLLDNKPNSWESCQVAFLNWIPCSLRSAKYRSLPHTCTCMYSYHDILIPFSRGTKPQYPFSVSLSFDLKNCRPTHFSVHFTWFLCLIWLNLHVSIKLPVQSSSTLSWSAEFKHRSTMYLRKGSTFLLRSQKLKREFLRVQAGRNAMYGCWRWTDRVVQNKCHHLAQNLRRGPRCSKLRSPIGRLNADVFHLLPLRLPFLNSVGWIGLVIRRKRPPRLLGTTLLWITWLDSSQTQSTWFSDLTVQIFLEGSGTRLMESAGPSAEYHHDWEQMA
jgi:hypothetical protein